MRRVAEPISWQQEWVDVDFKKNNNFVHAELLPHLVSILKGFSLPL
jgi:hypothetical protein